MRVDRAVALGWGYYDMRDFVKAEAFLDVAIALDDTHPDATFLAAAVAARMNRLQMAFDLISIAIYRTPDRALYVAGLGSLLMRMEDEGGARSALDKALELDPELAIAHSNRLFTKLYAEDIPAEDYAAGARAFGRHFADPWLRKRAFTHDRDPNRRLRIGFVSDDLCSHAVARLFEPFLEQFDRELFETHAYIARAAEDGLSLRMKPRFDHWLNIFGMSDDAAADRIEAGRIDILVDRSGHSDGHLLLVFARKPAPVQVTWMGHPATTGLSAMDYRLTDTVQDGEGCDALHAEAPWCLPRVPATYRFIALDPFPYNGGTTGCDTLCMGVPFVTLRGATAPERADAVVLGSMDLDELVATTQDFATDRQRLTRIREGQRERCLAGPMTDHDRLANEVGQAFRAMWTRWAAGEPCARG